MELDVQAEKNVDETKNFYKSAKKEFRNIGLLLFLQIFVFYFMIRLLGKESGSYGIILAGVTGTIPFLVYRIKYNDLNIENNEWSPKILIKWLVVLLVINISALDLFKALFGLVDPILIESSLESMVKITLTDSLLFIFYICLLGPILEEVVFRGIILRSFEKYGRSFAAVGSAILFGFAHGNILQIPVTIIMGIIFGIATFHYSLKFSILLHVLNNTFSVVTTPIILEFPILGIVVLLTSVLVILILGLKYRKKLEEAYLLEGKVDRKIMKKFITSIPILLYILFLFFSGISR